MADQIPDEEKLAIATHFLLSSPPYEIKEVLADVKVVLNPPTLLTDGVLKGIFCKYNTQNFEVVEKIITVLPPHIENIFICPNLACITHDEAVASHFKVEGQGKEVKLVCHFCEKSFMRNQVKVKHHD